MRPRRVKVSFVTLGASGHLVSLLPNFLLHIAWFDPIFHMNEALKGVAGRGLRWVDVSGSLLFLTAFAAISLVLGMASYRRMLMAEKRS
jgi:ABC-2 type transport system permease protein